MASAKSPVHNFSPRFFLRVDYSEFIRRQLVVIKVKKLKLKKPVTPATATERLEPGPPKSRTRPLCFEAGKSATTTVRSSSSFFFHACMQTRLAGQVSVVHFLPVPGGPVWSGLPIKSNQPCAAQRSAVQVQQLTRACACTAASVSRPFLSFPRHHQGGRAGRSANCLLCRRPTY